MLAVVPKIKVSVDTDIKDRPAKNIELSWILLPNDRRSKLEESKKRSNPITKQGFFYWFPWQVNEVEEGINNKDDFWREETNIPDVSTIQKIGINSVIKYRV